MKVPALLDTTGTRAVKALVGAAVGSLVLSIILPVSAAVARASRSGPEATGSRQACSLITEPDAGIGPIYALLAAATRSVNLSMYELADTGTESILAADAARGVHVRVILDQRSERARNRAAFTYLSAHGVEVRWAPDVDNIFHIKSVCIDGARCVVMTLNLVSRYYATTRDFAVVDGDQADIAAIEQAFAGDFSGHPGVPNSGAGLVWSPGSTAALTHLIGTATHTILVYNEELSDPDTVDALAAAARRGVRVEIVMTYAASWVRRFDILTAAGAQIRVLYGEHPVYIHAKMIWVDRRRVFLGSENLSETSLTRNRELGLISTDPTILAATQRTFDHDAARARTWIAPRRPRATGAAS